MKKTFIALLSIGLMSTSLMAVEGKIGQLKFDGELDTVVFKINKTAGGESVYLPVVATSVEMKKAIIAAVLTAKTANLDVDCYTKVIDGKKGWAIIQLK